MDLYFLAAGKPRHEALRIDAEDDEAVISEAKRIDVWKKPASFQVRAIRTTSRTGDRLVYSSAPADEAVAPPAGETLSASP
jgi:hypothetical protein